MSLLKDRLKEMVVSERHYPGKKKAVEIAICSQKGGVGKTTTAVNLGTTLSVKHGKKVLVVDLDPQGHVEKSLGALIPEGIEYTPISTVLLDRRGDILDGVIRSDLDNFFLTPGDKNLSDTENTLASKIGKEFILKNALRTAKSHYDYILFDCPPSIGNLTVNALVAARYVLIPCEMSVLAFEGVSDLVDTLAQINDRLNPSLDILGVLFTRIDGRNVQMNQLITENMKKYFDGQTFNSQIAINTALNKAQLEGRPIFHFDKNSTGTINYASLADEIIERTTASKKVVQISQAVKKA
jgi:chromosome partitioning protein